MGLFSWLWPRAAAAEEHRQPSNFCNSKFGQFWGPFVNNFVDTGFHGAPCGTPEQAGSDQGIKTVAPAAERLVAIGDLHGDLGKARRAFQTAGLTDQQDRWVGGKTVAVQVGDILDRGDDELRILYFLENLQSQAAAAGGALHVLNGNHETMNVMGNHRYATSGATTEIVRWNHWQQLASQLQLRCNCSSSKSQHNRPQQQPIPPPAALSAAEAQGMYGASHFTRTHALQPGSAIATRFFSWHPTVLQVGSTVFVHGGVLPHHVEYGLDRINRETSAWMRGQIHMHSSSTESQATSSVGSSASAASLTTTKAGSGSNSSSASNSNSSNSGSSSSSKRGGGGGGSSSTAKPLEAPQFLRTSKAIVWARDYSAEDTARCDCDKLQQVLNSIPSAARMVMGHTIQTDGINAACDGRALRVDVGMSTGCGDGQVEVLEILQDGAKVRRLREGMVPVDVSSTTGPSDTTAPPQVSPAPWIPAFIIPNPAAA